MVHTHTQTGKKKNFLSFGRQKCQRISSQLQGLINRVTLVSVQVILKEKNQDTCISECIPGEPFVLGTYFNTPEL